LGEYFALFGLLDDQGETEDDDRIALNEKRINGDFSPTYTTACAKNSLKSRTRRPPGAPV
jgi:hypothetical protein